MHSQLPSGWFRKRLKTELGILEKEGLLSAEQAAAISRRYRLDALASESTRMLLATIYFIGAALVGIGIISFVAAHWTQISREIKLVLIIGAMLAAHISGFILWKVKGNYPKLGHTLVLLGTLIFGANIGLVAQIFHVRANPYDGFAAWALGAAAIAWAVKSTPNAVTALIAAAIFALGSTAAADGSRQVGWFLPAAAVVFVPLVYYLRSQWVVWGTLLVMSVCWAVSLTEYELFRDPAYPFAAGTSLLGMIFFCWGLAGWKVPSSRFLCVPCQIVGLFWGILAVFLASFLDYSTEMIGWAIGRNELLRYPGYLITAGGLAAAAVGLAIWAGPLLKNTIQAALLGISVGCFVAAGILPQVSTADIVVLGAHLILLLAIGILFYASLKLEDRRIFWASVLLAAVVVLARTLEYEIGLLVKSAIFTTCGIGLILAGILFERYLRIRRRTHD